jgi:excisionase family DNA binding protein
MLPLLDTVGPAAEPANAGAARARPAEDPTPGADQRLVMSIAEACQALGIGETTLRQLLASGRLPVLRLGRRVLIPRSAIGALVAGAAAEPCADRPVR